MYAHYYNNVCTQVRTTVYVRGRGLWASDGVDKHYKPRTRPPCWVRRGLQGVRTLCTVLSDLGGGVNGHDVNLRDKCGVCDDVTG